MGIGEVVQKRMDRHFYPISVTIALEDGYIIFLRSHWSVDTPAERRNGALCEMLTLSAQVSHHFNQ